MKVLTRGLQFPEGPIALDDGSVLVVEIEGGTLARVAPDGTVTRIDCGGGPNGAALGPDGAVCVGNNGGLLFMTEGGIRIPYGAPEGTEGGYVQRVDLATGSVETLFTHVDGAHIGNLNDIVFDEHGSCYIVDTTRGMLYYSDPVKGTIAVAEEGLDYPNGLALSPDGSRLYASETFTGRLVGWDVKAPGTLAGKAEIYATGGAHHWDGLAVDGAGNICAANLEKSGISAVSPDGKVLREFVTPDHDPFITNICFGGPDGDTAFICSAGLGILYATPWPWPGLRLNFAR